MWFKVDDRLWSHPKWLHLSAYAKALWIPAASYCVEYMSDGRITRYALVTFEPDGASNGVTACATRELIDAGLWEETDQEGVYQFHDWEHYQMTKAQYQAEKSKNAERQKAFRNRKRNANVTANVTQTSRVTNSAPNPNPNHIEKEPTYVGKKSSDSPPQGTTAPRKRDATKRGTRLPDNWQPNQALLDWARTNHPHVNLDFETAQFVDYWLASSGKNAVKLDWDRTWQTWIRRTAQTTSRNQPQPMTTTQRVQGWLALSTQTPEGNTHAPQRLTA